MPPSARRKRARNSRQTEPERATSRPIIRATTPLDYLKATQIEQLHQAALRILRTTGVIFRSATALDYFRSVGARIDNERVFIEAELVEHCLKSAPSQYTLNARNAAQSVLVGGDQTVIMPGGGPAFVRDLAGVRRSGTLADMENFTRLTAISPDVHVVARKAVEAQDIPVAIRHLECWRSALTLADKPVQSGFVLGQAEAEDALEMLAAVFDGSEAIDSFPVAHCSVNVNSPLLYDTPMIESLIEFARVGQPILIAPFVMAGVSGPTTLAGTHPQQNAEVLAGMALVQLVRPGTPVLYGTATSNIDLRSGAPAIGSPESAASVAACAQLARYYGLPSRGGGALTDSPVPDAQSQYERMW